MTMTTRFALVGVLLLASCDGDDDNGPPAVPGPDPDPATVKVERAFPALSFTNPLFLTTAPGEPGRVYVVTQRGEIFVFDNDDAVSSATLFLDINDRVTNDGGEQGLLGLAFDPGYQQNGFLYVNYNPNFDNSEENPRRTHISRFTVPAPGDAAVADPDSETVLLTYDQPFPNHKGGWLGFGPDGKLYIATGDGGSAGDPGNRAQNIGSLLGKILRVNKDGTAPADNPFFGVEGACEQVWAFGLRNPYRASFDRQTGELWAGDVGQGQREEVDKIVKGGNYGWRKFEGTRVFNETDPTPPDAIPPVLEYGHDQGRCTVIGGYVYRGTDLTGLQGNYFFADFCSGELWRSAAEGEIIGPIATIPGSPSSFGEDADGELYVTSFDGGIYRLALD